jgi:AcrR family transcriptional regulator
VATELSPWSRARAKNAQRILEATRALVNERGLDGLSMRQLAERAEVSVRTIYNIFADRQAVIVALVQQSFDAIDGAIATSAVADPLERIWETVTVSIDAYCRHVPAAVIAAVVTDRGLNATVAPRWHGRQLLLEAVTAAVRCGALRDEISPERLLDQAGPVHAHRLVQWAHGDIDDDALRAGVLYAYDLCLIAVARPRARTRLLEHLTGLESSMPPLIVGIDGHDLLSEQNL